MRAGSAEKTDVLNLTPQPQLLVEQLAELQVQINQCGRDALTYAREAGVILLGVAAKEREALAREAGITGRRSRFVYQSIAQHWEAVQLAASIRAALKIIKAGEHAEPVDRRDVPLPFEDRCVNDTHRGLPIGECAVTSKQP